jgi:predicted metalloprotease with PDZ domain
MAIKKVPAQSKKSATVHYQVELADLHAHLYRITLTVTQPAALQELRLPVWIPGSYLVREFSKNLQKLQCLQEGRKCKATQTTKATWQVQCNPEAALQVQYEVYAFDNSVRTAWLEATRGFFNGTSLCLIAVGHEHLPHTLELPSTTAPNSWSVATGLTPLRADKRGWGSYQADNYDALVDCPVELGSFWSGSFVAGGVPHRFVVAGATPSFDGEKLLADARTICQTAIDFWAENKGQGKKAKAPFSSYVFMLNAVHDGYGGLEHRNSTALICNRKDLPRAPRTTLAPTQHKQPEGYTTLLGLISHEYFHTWNVKRLRPAEFARYDYTQENYTELLWFFEGFTSYYDDLLLRHAKLIDNATYLKLLGKTINQVQQTPGRQVQSVAQASFDAWVKYYRQDENTANATVSYYTKGSLVALCLDLSLRTHGRTTLDAVMRGLWTRCAGGPMTEHDLLEVLWEQTGKRWNQELQRWVHGTSDLPVTELLERHGIEVHRDPDQVAQQLGLRVKENDGLHISQVLRGGAAEKAGFASGDEWLAVQWSGAPTKDAASAGPWRIQTMDELTLYSGPAKKVTALVARDKRILSLQLTLPQSTHSVRLTVRDATAVARWLDGAPQP